MEGPAPPQLAMAPCSSNGSVRSLPRFDPYVMEVFMDDQRELKKKVYDLFKLHPDLLPPVEEGLSKGEGWAGTWVGDWDVAGRAPGMLGWPW